MAKALSIQNLYSKRFETLRIQGDWRAVLGEPEASGAWLIWGKDKNGKTRCALQLANLLSDLTKVLYVSAEEGTGKAFVESCRRSNISEKNRRLLFSEYIDIEDLKTRLNKRGSERIIAIDNVTFYNDDLKNGVLKELLKTYPQKLFLFLAHEDRNEPYTSTAKLIKKLAKVIIYVEGLACTVSGRVPGGVINLDEFKAKIYHGEQKTKEES